MDPLLVNLSEYALLAATAYGGEDTIGAYCPSGTLQKRHWAPMDGYLDADGLDYGRPGRISIPGLGFRLWKDQAAKGNRFALVFRGTDFREFGDWYSNARWFTRLNPFTWDQYGQIRTLMPLLIKRLDAEFGDYQLISIGHSLGGGLAQHAAFNTDRIRAVYAFDTSPVTAASSIDPRVKKQYRQGLRIFRSYEAGEVLAGVRWVGRRVLPLSKANPKIVEVRFNLRSTFSRGSQGGGPIGQHSIRQLACDLICRVDRAGDPQHCHAKVR